MLAVGPFFTNCYVVWCGETKEAIVIDPGFVRQNETEQVLSLLKKNKLDTKYIVDTHGHPDHICGNGAVKDATGAPILIHKLDANMLSHVKTGAEMLFGFQITSPQADGFLEENDVVGFGGVNLRVLHTPGHSPGSISLLGADCVFSGDTLFAGSIGRVDLPNGSSKDIMKSLKEKLAILPDRFIVYPGHGPKTTIGNEKRINPFLQEGFDPSLLI
jgi:glyoxylase-like metal-dependent hydrolase (beta-lactamase superfamily II)